MPIPVPRRPCLVRGCRLPAADHRGRCRDHAADHDAQLRASHDWRDYDGDEWRRARKAALERDGFACLRCGTTAGSLLVHHRRPLADGGTHALANLATLCAPCHGIAHRELARATARASRSRRPST